MNRIDRDVDETDGAAVIDLTEGSGDRPREAGGRRPGDLQDTDGAHGPDDGVIEDDEDTDYRRRLGARLRAVRRGHGLRLRDVEQDSDGRFKAVVIGSYERGDRAVSAHKLASLARFYGVPIAELLPDDGWPVAEPLAPSSLRLSVAALASAGDDPAVTSLRRVVQHVQVLRHDHHGQVVTLRGDDLRTFAITLGIDVADLPGWLEGRGLLAQR